jgi:hypothetical protein
MEPLLLRGIGEDGRGDVFAVSSRSQVRGVGCCSKSALSHRAIRGTGAFSYPMPSRISLQVGNIRPLDALYARMACTNSYSSAE